MAFNLKMGDCLEIMRQIPTGSVDLILCDLPYGTTACSWDSVIPLVELWAEYKRIRKDDATAVFTACQPFTTALISSNMPEFKYSMVWKKPQGVDPFMSKIRPLNNIEDVLIFAKKSAMYNPQFEVGKPYTRKAKRDKNGRTHEITGATMLPSETVNEGYRYPTRIIECGQERGHHPTQKPVALMEYLIKTYSNPGEVVLDNTMGSGTTGVACMNTDRLFIGIERDPGYFSIAQSRIESAYFKRLESLCN